MSNKPNYSYIGIATVILVFGIIFIPKIINRVSSDDVSRDESRSKAVTTQKSNLAYLEINNESKTIFNNNIL